MFVEICSYGLNRLGTVGLAWGCDGPTRISYSFESDYGEPFE